MMSPQRSKTVEAADDNYAKVKRLQRAQWLRAAILGASDGLLSTTSLMLGVGAAEEDRRSMVLSGLAGAVAGAFSMAVGEFVSVATQREIEKANISRPSSKSEGQGASAIKIEISIEKETKHVETLEIIQTTSDPIKKQSPDMEVLGEDTREISEDKEEEMVFTNPYKAAAASGLAFLCGASPPLLPAIFITQYATRIVVIIVVTSMGLASFGGFGAFLGGSPIRLSALRAMVGGCIAMSVTYGLLKPFDSNDGSITI